MVDGFADVMERMGRSKVISKVISSTREFFISPLHISQANTQNGPTVPDVAPTHTDGNVATPPPPGGPSRRNFMRGAMAVGAAIVFEAWGLATLRRWRRLPPAPIAQAVVFPDPSLCIGCLTCEVICSRVHEEQGLSSMPRIRIFNNPETILHPEIEANYPGRGQFLQQPCLQCTTAECLYVCPVNAFQVEPISGARIILEDTCVSCGRCANACPFPVYDEAEATNQDILGQFSRISYDEELDIYTKCDLCYWRPEGPACVERCPVNIRIWQGIIESDTLCLDKPPSTQGTWEKLRAFQTFFKSPAPPPGTV